MKKVLKGLVALVVLAGATVVEAATNASEVATEMQTEITTQVGIIIPIVAAVIVSLFAFPLIKFTWRKIKGFLK